MNARITAMIKEWETANIPKSTILDILNYYVNKNSRIEGQPGIPVNQRYENLLVELTTGEGEDFASLIQQVRKTISLLELVEPAAATTSALAEQKQSDAAATAALIALKQREAEIQKEKAAEEKRALAYQRQYDSAYKLYQNGADYSSEYDRNQRDFNETAGSYSSKQHSDCGETGNTQKDEATRTMLGLAGEGYIRAANWLNSHPNDLIRLASYCSDDVDGAKNWMRTHPDYFKQDGCCIS